MLGLRFSLQRSDDLSFPTCDLIVHRVRNGLETDAHDCKLQIGSIMALAIFLSYLLFSSAFFSATFPRTGEISSEIFMKETHTTSAGV